MTAVRLGESLLAVWWRARLFMVVRRADRPLRRELSVEVANVQYFEGRSLIPNKSPGRLTFSDVTLERAATQDRDLFENVIESVTLTYDFFELVQ